MRRGHHTPILYSPPAVTPSLFPPLKLGVASASNIPIRSSLQHFTRVLSSLSQHPLLTFVVAHSLPLCRFANALPAPLQRRKEEPSSVGTASADTSYLPAQIGGIVGSYAISLVLVATALLLLSKRRRERLNNGENETEFLANVDKPQVVEEQPPLPFFPDPPLSPRSIPRSPVVLNINTNLGPAPDHNAYVTPASPTSTTRSPLGIDPTVDQRVVTADRIMAQSQLEDMYKYVMEHDEAKRNGTTPPPIPALSGDNRSSGGHPGAGPSRPSTSGGAQPVSILKKERARPSQLNLAAPEEEKRQSKASSLFAALRSPKKKSKGVSISSPIMTPMSGTFPRESRELNTIPPRQYAPAPPPPIPTDQVSFRRPSKSSNFVPATPDDSPVGTMSIDERLGREAAHSRMNSAAPSAAPTEPEPVSAESEHSQAPLVGLPQSPKPGVNRFPTLPASPRASRFSPPPSLPLTPRAGSFSRPNAPSAVRTGGTLPLRAYAESSLASPTSSSIQTKQTVFERSDPLSPKDGRTPFTGAALPYSPYQPFTPCVPVTPSLVTKADRKRMRRLEPKTPTLQMVQSSEDMW